MCFLKSYCSTYQTGLQFCDVSILTLSPYFLIKKPPFISFKESVLARDVLGL